MLHLLAELHVECAEWLVEQECGWSIDERAGQGDALLLAARELGGLASLEALQLHRLDGLCRAGAHFVALDALDAQAKLDVLLDRHVGEKRVGLEDHVDVALGWRHACDVGASQDDRPLGRHLEAGDHAKRCCLTAAGGTKHREEFALADAEINVVDDDVLSKRLRHSVEHDMSVHGISLSPVSSYCDCDHANCK